MFKKLFCKNAAVHFSILIIWGLMAIGATHALMPQQRKSHKYNKAVDVCVGESIGIDADIDQDGNQISSLVDEVNKRLDEVRAADQGIRDACIIEILKMTQEERLEYIKDI
jgi:hypothetical protein